MRRYTQVPWLLLLLLLVGAAWSIRPVSDTDILWHLRAGEWMLAHGDVIRQDPFSATRWGCAWISVPWLHEILLVKLVAAWGWLGPTLWQAAMTVALAVEVSLLVWLLRRRGTRWDWRWPHLSIPAALAVLLMLRLLQMRINHRPEMYSYLFVGLFLILLLRTARPRSADRGGDHWAGVAVWLVPFVQVVWTNTHGAFILGPLIAGAFAVAAWVNLLCCSHATLWRAGCPAQSAGTTGEGRRASRAALPALRLTLVALLTALACFATPYGDAGTFYPFHLFRVLMDPVYSQAIVEARPVHLSTALDSGSLGYALLACWVLAVLGLFGRLFESVQCSVFSVQKSVCPPSPSQLNTEHRTLNTFLTGLWHTATVDLGLGYLAVLTTLAALSLTAIRNVPFLPLVAAPLVAACLEYAADGADGLMRPVVAIMRRWRGTAVLARLRSFALRLLLALALVLLYRSIVSERFYDALGWRTRFAVGLSDHEHPLAAAAFLDGHRDALPASATVYGDTRSANLLLARFGPAWKTYFDGRHAEIYDPATFRRAIACITDTNLFAREAAAYGIDVVCLALVDAPDGRRPLSTFLYGQTNDWALVRLDDCAAVFVSRASARAAFADGYALPAPPVGAAAQRDAFTAWLYVQGRGSLADLDDPGNDALADSVVAATLVRTMQLGGLWAPSRHLDGLRYCRLAAFLDRLGWQVVADDLYVPALRYADQWPAVLPRAINHAIRMHRSTTDPDVRRIMLARLRARVAMLARVAPGSALVTYGNAYVAVQEGRGRTAQAVAMLEPLAARSRNAPLLDLLSQAQMALGDATKRVDEQRRLWLAAVATCRRWQESRGDGGSGHSTSLMGAGPANSNHDDAAARRIHARLADLMTRLNEPALAAANLRLAGKEQNTETNAARAAPAPYQRRSDDGRAGPPDPPQR